MEILNWILANYAMFLAAFAAVLVAVVALSHALIAVFAFIPGSQPEAALQKVVDLVQSWVDFIAKFSKK